MSSIFKRIILLSLALNFTAIQPMEQSYINATFEGAHTFLEAIKSGLISANDRVIQFVNQERPKSEIIVVAALIYGPGGIYLLYKNGTIKKAAKTIKTFASKHPNLITNLVLSCIPAYIGYQLAQAPKNNFSQHLNSAVPMLGNYFTGLAIGGALLQLYEKFEHKFRNLLPSNTATACTFTASPFNRINRMNLKQQQLKHKILQGSDIEQSIALLNNHIRSGYNVNQIFFNGKSLLHELISLQDFTQYHYQLMKILLEQFKANPNVKDSNQNSPLYVACQSNLFDYCKLLLEHGAAVNDTNRFGQTALHIACKNNYKNICRLLLKHKASVNVKDSKDCTPLFYAALAHDEELCNLLVTHGAQYDWQNMPNNIEVYSRARENSHDSIIKSFINAGLPGNLADSHGTTPLHIAVMNEWYDCASALLERGANANAADQDGNTPLMVAVIHQNRKLVDLLLKYNIDVNQQNREGKTALMFACEQSDNIGILKKLIAANADLNIIDNDGGFAVLHYAIQAKDYEYIKLSLENGAHINQRDTFLGRTPLMLACEISDKQCVELLLENHADAELVDNNGNSAFLYAQNNPQIMELIVAATNNLHIVISPDSQYSGDFNQPLYSAWVNIIKKAPNTCIINDLKNIDLHSSIGNQVFKKTAIKLVINKNLITALQQNNTNLIQDAIEDGGEINITTDHQITPLMIAIQNNNLQIVEKLLNCGAFVNTKDDEGNSPLHYASKIGNPQITQLLIKNGADIDNQNEWGETPLFIAVSKQDPAIVEQLLKAGASVELSDNKYNCTPLLIALASNDTECAKLLIEAGSNPNVSDKLGSAMHYACMHKNVELIHLLAQAGADTSAKNQDGQEPFDLI